MAGLAPVVRAVVANIVVNVRSVRIVVTNVQLPLNQTIILISKSGTLQVPGKSVALTHAVMHTKYVELHVFSPHSEFDLFAEHFH